MTDVRNAQTLLRLLKANDYLGDNSFQRALDLLTQPAICKALVRAFEYSDLSGANRLLQHLI